MVPLATWVDDPSVWAVILLFAGMVLLVQFLGRLREGRERRRIRGRCSEVSDIETITPPEGFFAAKPSPAQKFAVETLPTLTWPTGNTSLAASVVSQLGRRYQALPDRDQFFYYLSLLATSLEAQGDHFDQLFCDAGGVPWDVHEGIIAFLQEHAEAQLAEALQCAMSWRHFRFGNHPLEGSTAMLNGEVVDLCDEAVPEKCCDAAMKSNPHGRFFRILHTVLADYFDWPNAPEDRSYRPVLS